MSIKSGVSKYKACDETNEGVLEQLKNHTYCEKIKPQYTNVFAQIDY